MSVTKQSMINYTYARLLTAGLLLISASGQMGELDHFGMRIIVCLTALAGLRYAFALDRLLWKFLMGASAVVFNPFWHPHHLGRAFWVTCDLVVVGLLFWSFRGLKAPDVHA